MIPDQLPVPDRARRVSNLALEPRKSLYTWMCQSGPYSKSQHVRAGASSWDDVLMFDRFMNFTRPSYVRMTMEAFRIMIMLFIKVFK